MVEVATVFVVLGEALLDLVQPEPGPTYVARPGGGPFNIAVGLRRLGHETALMARLSTGALGTLVRQHALANGLDLRACVDVAEPATLAFASVDAEGRAAYDFYVVGTADWGWTPAELSRLPDRTRYLHTGSLATALLPGADAILDLLRAASAEQRCLITFDPNVRPALAGARAAAVERVEAFVGAAHVVKASDEDLAWLYPDDEPAAVAARWWRLGPRLVVVTRGPDGCLAVTPDGTTLARLGRPAQVTDTIGAGDAFMSGLLSGLADAGVGRPGDVTALTPGMLTGVLDRAVLIAAMTCERPGADPPTRQQYDERAADRSSGA